ncbi:MAG: hypothetical protein HGA85_00445 [Nanoarchaeota archaeon]|nr:hypothetical protein [Nanoarchaeota archaeon]
MEKWQKVSAKLSAIILSFLVLFVNLYLYLNGKIIFELLLALLFLQSLISGLMLFTYFLYKKFQRLADNLGFIYIQGTFMHPKFEGHYKGKWFQLHFVSKETGGDWGVPMTYVKLQWKEKKTFDDKKLAAHNRKDYKHSSIIEIKHVVRDYKNYLLLKRRWFTFSPKKIEELMDLLISLSESAKKKTVRKA